MNTVLIVIGDATETVDTLYPYYRLQEDGFEPVVAARMMGRAPGQATESETTNQEGDYREDFVTS